jgi:hypothetical protein
MWPTVWDMLNRALSFVPSWSLICILATGRASFTSGPEGPPPPATELDTPLLLLPTDEAAAPPPPLHTIVSGWLESHCQRLWCLEHSSIVSLPAKSSALPCKCSKRRGSWRGVVFASSVFHLNVEPIRTNFFGQLTRNSILTSKDTTKEE